MKRYVMISIIILAVSLFLNSCGVSSKSFIYHEPSIKRQKVKVTKIAIVPNRLPLNLTDPEKWRHYNWGIASEYLMSRGYQVVDYRTSVEAFDQSGLPVEDTKSSRDKYAELAQLLSVDMIAIPYYGTMASAKTSLIWTNMQWHSLATFQFYSTSHNDFVTRLDLSGTDTYTSGVLPLLSVGVMFIDPLAGLISQGLALIVDLSNTVFKSNDAHWRGAFKKAIKNGLRPLVMAYPPNRQKMPDTAKILSPSSSATEEQTDEQFIKQGLHTYIIGIKKSLLVINEGAKKGIAVGQICRIYALYSNSSRYFRIGVGRIEKIKSNRAVVRTTQGKGFKKGDLCVVKIY